MEPPRWKPALNAGVDLRELPLTPEEGFVASRLDGSSDLHVLSQVTGLPAERIEAALAKLVSLGAVAGAGAAVTDAAGDDADAEAEDSDAAADAGTHRRLFEAALHQLTSAERVAKAKSAVDPELSALCYDPLPAVVHALLENPRFGLTQARLVATHHRAAGGLEAVAAVAAFAADGGVRRSLLKNPQLPASLLRRLHGNRRLLEQHKLVISRELPEQTRRTARELLRARFSAADADERVEVMVKTEGRCLTALAGLPIDARTSALLCARSYTSTLFVQNISRWAAAPPALIAHLLKQELVRRSPSLKLQLQRHPNAPAGERG